MQLKSDLFSLSDIFLGPLCFVILLMIMSMVVRKYYKDDKIKRLFIRAFYFKIAFTIAYCILNTFYYKGGDTVMYYHATQVLHKAAVDDVTNIPLIFSTNQINVKTELMNYFIYTDSRYPIFEAMHERGNFMVPKLALPLSLLFANNYLCITLFFSFFALGGAIRLFKVFYHYFPQYYRELAFAILFLPSVAFWSSGLLKDPICFGAVGYIVHGIFSIFIRKKKYISSLAWIVICGLLLYQVKVYILLALSPAIVLWIFSEFNKVVENKTLRAIMAGMTFVAGALCALLLINYVTSDESLQRFRFDTITETSAQQRELYEEFSQNYEGSYYSVGTSNPVLLVLNGLIATLFRPFIWEVNGPTAFLSAIESLLFLFITITLMYRKGVLNFFRQAMKEPIFLMCLVFSLVFAAAIGSTALNFGSLSRYKIPCLPFYLSMVLILYRQQGLQYPQWFRKLLGYTSQPMRSVVKKAF